jgi:hypothetical protein
MEERMCQQAQRTGAPALAREFSAAQLGADADTLDAQFGAATQAQYTQAREFARTQDATQLTRTGLRMDQAAVIYEALTSTRRVSVGVGPAGSGKTHAAAAGARAWQAAGGEVIGLTCAQAARDVLAAAGIKNSYNTSKFLRMIDQGEPVRPGTLFVVDEGSMVPMNHLARIIDLAEKHGCKVFVTGDHHQLAAVESGGGMTMLASHLGYTLLTVPVRFEAEWERDASLRLRAGDKSALEAYAEHGRIIGVGREEALDLLRQRYVARRLAGEDSLLMAHDRDDCRELSRMIRDDLIHLGLVDAGPSVQITEGERASAGDVIVCRENDSRVETDRGHKLTNGDIFKIERVFGNGAWVRRVLAADRQTSWMRLAEHAFFYGESKLRSVTDLAYVVTGHKGMGGTVRGGQALVTGTEPREWLYVAMTRGTEDNTVAVITHDGVKTRGGIRLAVQPGEADPAPGTRPDPELGRRERLDREQEGLPPEPTEIPDDQVRDRLAVLADCLDREDAELSASDYRQRALSNADHLSIFAAITRTHSVEVRTQPDRSLEHMRTSYKSETGWAPPHVGRHLRDVRLGAETMRLKAIRAEAEARLATGQATARHAGASAKARELEAQYREHEATLGQVMDERGLWDKLTEGSRRLAVQADSELRRRYPDRKIPALESAEPKAPEEPAVEPGWLAELQEQRRVFRDEYEARQNVTVPAEDTDWQHEGLAWPGRSLWRDAIVQPPKPQIRPAEPVLEAVGQREAQLEPEL